MLCAAAHNAYVATTGPQQAPHVSPTWYLWDAANRHLLISLTTGRQKYRNMRRDPHVAVCIPDPQNPYRHIEIRGIAEGIEPDADHRLINALAKRYLDETNTPHTCRGMCAWSFESSHTASEALAERLWISSGPGPGRWSGGRGAR